MEAFEPRTLLAGVISGVVFQDYNANGVRDTGATIANTGNGTVGVAVDRGLAGVVATAYDSAGVVRGTATSTAAGAYSITAAGVGPYRVEFTNLPAGFNDGAKGTGSGSTVQFVPDGNSTANLGLVDPRDFNVDNPDLVTNTYIYGDPINGPYANQTSVFAFPYNAGSQYGTGNDTLPTTRTISVPVKSTGAIWGLGYNQSTRSIYAASYTKRFAGYGPNAAGTGTTNGAVYSINRDTGVASVLADLNTIFGANTAGVDFRTLPAWTGYLTDGGNTGWDAVGKTSLGGLDVSPDGSTVYVMNLADRSLYAIPTSGPINAATVRRASIPFNAPGATGTAGGTTAGDLRPFAVQYYQGQIYVGMVNSAESTQNAADLRGYVYTVNPTTLAFSAAPVFQFQLNYPRLSAAAFSGSGNPDGEWLPWRPTFATIGAGTTSVYPQPMLSSLAFDSSGNMTIGVRDRDGDQTGFFTNANPANPNGQYEGMAAGDTLRAFINTPNNPASGWTFESNARGPSGQGAGPQNTANGPGNGLFYYQQNYNTSHSHVSTGGILQVPGFPDVVSTVFDPNTTVVRTGGLRWYNTTTGATTKDYQTYNTGFNAPPQSTFGKAAGVGDVALLADAAPIELGDRVFRDSDGDGIQDPGEPGIAGVTLRLYRGSTLVGTTTTDANGNYLFTNANVAENIRPGTAYQIRMDNSADFLAGGPLAGLLPSRTGASAIAGSKAVLSGATPIISVTTGAAGSSDHTLDAGFLTPGTLAGSVYIDANNNGVRNGGEAGIAGVVITLTGTDDLGNAVSRTATTAADGSYTFANLRPSNAAGYAVAQSAQPAAYLDGRDAAGNLGGTAAPPPGDAITGIVVGAGAVGTGYTFGEIPASAVAGAVYVDSNNDGIRQATEVGIAGVTITLTGVDDLGNAVNLTTTTLGDGSYAFVNLRPSSAAGYTVTEVAQPVGFLDGRDTVGSLGGTAGNDVFTALVAGPGVAGTGYNFGELAPASLGGSVYLDANNDGVKQPAEAGIAGVTVTLTGTNDLGAAVNLTATTTASGAYLFTNLRPGTYAITETQPAGFLDGRDAVGSQGGTLGNDTITGIALASGVNGINNNFGEVQAASVSGFVYVDATNDGVRLPTSVGIAGVTVTLTGVNDLGAPVNLTTTTGANGSYSFTGLRPSNAAGYTITEPIQPAGFFDGRDAAGSLGGTAGNDVITNVVLASGAAGINYNFGEILPSSLAGSVYVDSNNDGIRQPGEPSIPGVTINLTGTDDLGNAVSLTTTTDAAGSYIFNNLRPGVYTMTEVQPAAYSDGQDTLGTGGGTLGNDSFASIGIRSGQTATGYLFGERGATISGFVYVDANNNATRDAGEAGLAGVTINILNAANVVVATVVTAADGSYSVPDLPAGDYTVQEVQPTGLGSSTPNSVPVALTTAGLPNLNFGETTSSITGRVYNDANNDGIRQTGEPNIGGVTVTLTGTDANGNPVNRTLVTGSNGTFSFTGLLSGTYTLTETQPAAYTDGLDTAGTAGGVVGNDVISAIALPAGFAATGYNFGELGNVVSGTVYVDANRDGTRQAAEIGVAGVTITLLDAGNNVVGTATTDANGLYTFSNVAPGTYTIVETQPNGYGSTTSNTLAVNLTTPSLGAQDFGETLASIAGIVYNDLNNDGIHQLGEPFIAGVTITLTGIDANGAAVNLSQATAADGSYLFPNLLSGTYAVTETQPAAYNDGIDSLGTAGGILGNDVITAIPLGAGVVATGYNFGEVGSTISGTVYADVDGNNVRGPGEPGIGGVTITLLDGLGNTVATTTTAANGTYSFPGLPAGSYTVVETQPPGYGPATPDLIPVTLTTGGLPGVDFGDSTSSISGLVYLDLDNDGLEVGEPGIGGVTITLIGTDASGRSVSLTTVTAADGSYSFTGLVGGTYALSESQPAAYLDGIDAIGNSGGILGADIVTGITLAPGFAATGYTFGEQGTSIRGIVFSDLNGSGGKSASEPGIGGVTLTLLDGLGNPIATTTTAADGSYVFPNLPAGSYTVVETQPNGYGSSTPNSVPVALTTSGVTGLNFGETTSSISGRVYLDRNADAAYQPGVDIVGAGSPITLTGIDANGNPVSFSGVTAADGTFTFSGLLSGNYTLNATPYPGATSQPGQPGSVGGTPAVSQVSAIALPAGTQAVDYLFRATGVSLTGTVYLDTDRDGVRDPGEAGVPGVVVTLIGTNVNNGQNIVLTTTTDAAGNYAFNGIPSGTYPISISPTTAYGNSTPAATTAVVPSAGLTNQNFGLAPGTISGVIYANLQRDGVLEPDEIAIPGVLVLLTGTDVNGVAITRSTVTGANGAYAFNDLPAGTYSVSQPVQPAGYLDGVELIGSAGGVVGNDVFTGIVIGAGASGTRYDFSELSPASLSGHVFFDANNDGVHDPNETGIAGVTVTLIGTDDLGNAVGLTTTTAADGSYIFANLRPSGPEGYTITEGQPAGYFDGKDVVGSQGGILGNDTISAIVLAPGINGTENDFGELVPASVGGAVYIDNNDNAVRESTEPGIGGVTVTLTGIDDLGNPVNLTTVTAADGSYVFNNLRPSGDGGYSVAETHPAGYLEGKDPTTGLANTSFTGGVVVTPGAAVRGIDFADLRPGTISGYVYADLNNGGAKGVGEPGIAGVTVTLSGYDDQRLPVLLTTVTDANGFYSFTNLRPAFNDPREDQFPNGYTITETQPAGYLDGLDSVGSVGGVGGNDVVSGVLLTEGATSFNNNFGELPPASLSGSVFLDANNNGLWDMGEGGSPA